MSRRLGTRDTPRSLASLGCRVSAPSVQTKTQQPPVAALVEVRRSVTAWSTYAPQARFARTAAGPRRNVERRHHAAALPTSGRRTRLRTTSAGSRAFTSEDDVDDDGGSLPQRDAWGPAPHASAGCRHARMGRATRGHRAMHRRNTSLAHPGLAPATRPSRRANSRACLRNGTGKPTRPRPAELVAGFSCAQRAARDAAS